MNNCRCGVAVRLGGHRITINRKHGVVHYVAHMEQTKCLLTEGFSCLAMKPYPRREEDKEWFKLVARWNAENPKRDG